MVLPTVEPPQLYAVPSTRVASCRPFTVCVRRSFFSFRDSGCFHFTTSPLSFLYHVARKKWIDWITIYAAKWGKGQPALTFTSIFRRKKLLTKREKKATAWKFCNHLVYCAFRVFPQLPSHSHPFLPFSYCQLQKDFQNASHLSFHFAPENMLSGNQKKISFL